MVLMAAVFVVVDPWTWRLEKMVTFEVKTACPRTEMVLWMTAEPHVNVPAPVVCTEPCMSTFPPNVAAWFTFREDDMKTELRNWLWPPTLRPPIMSRFDPIRVAPSMYAEYPGRVS